MAPPTIIPHSEMRIVSLLNDLFSYSMEKHVGFIFFSFALFIKKKKALAEFSKLSDKQKED